jgi:predicted DNA-binding transcriptional regulator YafY
LVAALLVLQARGRVTAKALAEELEVSERTARRDLEALAMAGIPVYPQPGRGGGWALVGGARTDLSGLTAPEVRTLFLLAGPAAATPEVKAALRKLLRALPVPFRADAEAAAKAVVVDSTGWDHYVSEPPPHLAPLQRAVIDGVQVRLAYTRRDNTDSERTVHPLGLVAKGRTWYLIANTDSGLRTFRLSRIRSILLTADPVERPPDFDLESTWRSTLASIDDMRQPYEAVLAAPAALLPALRSALGNQPRQRATLDDGRLELLVRSYSAGALARQLAGFGASVEVLSPVEARHELGRIGESLAVAYGRR